MKKPNTAKTLPTVTTGGKPVIISVLPTVTRRLPVAPRLILVLERGLFLRRMRALSRPLSRAHPRVHLHLLCCVSVLCRALDCHLPPRRIYHTDPRRFTRRFLFGK